MRGKNAGLEILHLEAAYGYNGQMAYTAGDFKITLRVLTQDEVLENHSVSCLQGPQSWKH